MSSDVARLRQQIEEEYAVAQQGLYGLAAGTARHDFITKRMERAHVCFKELVQQIGHEQAVHILVSSVWSQAEIEEAARGQQEQ